MITHPRGSRRHQAGLTLVELMVAMLIVSIALAAALAVGYSMLNGYREQRRLDVVQRATRVSLEIISNAIRGASPGTSSGEITDLVACNTFGSIGVVNSTTASDELKLIYASGWVMTSLRATFDESSSELVVLSSDGLKIGDYVLVSDFEKAHLVEIKDINAHAEGASLGIDVPTTTACGSGSFPTGGYTAGRLVIRAKMARFYLEDTSAGPTLMLDPDDIGPSPGEPLAEGVEDMQIAYGVDLNDDGFLTEDGGATDEWFFNNPADGAPPAMSANAPLALRVTLVGRTTFETSNAPASTRPAIEDRLGGAAPDPHRRRSMAATVEIRNLRASK